MLVNVNMVVSLFQESILLKFKAALLFIAMMVSKTVLRYAIAEVLFKVSDFLSK
jgi:hypothetical protein